VVRFRPESHPDRLAGWGDQQGERIEMHGTSLGIVRTRRSRSLAAFAAATIALVALASPAVVAAALPTSTTLSAAQTTVIAGDAVSLTASVTPAPSGGAVTFIDSQFGFLGTAEVDTETNTAGITVTLAPGTHVISATFSGVGDFTGSTSAPVTIQATLGTTAGTPTSTTLTLATPGAAEGDLAELRATVAPIPDDGRVQFMEGNRLLGTAPIDATTGQALLPIATLSAGTHQVIAIFTGSAAFSGSASPPTAITIAADTIVRASGVSVSHATIYPVTDGVGDTINIRGRTEERTSITIAIINSAGKRVRSIGLGTKIGAYSTNWNGRTSSGTIVPAGRYTVMQTLVDLRRNRLVVSSPLVVSHKRLVNIEGEITRTGLDFTREGSEGFGFVFEKGSNDSVHVWGNVSPDWAFVSYTFRVPSSTRYTRIRFEVEGEAQAGRTGAMLALLDASGEPVVQRKTGTKLGTYAVQGGATAVNGRDVTATVTANGADDEALWVYNVKLLYTYQVFR
jgi:hypothetical protein